MPSLAGQQKVYIIEQMSAFRDGKRPATIMHQLAKGYTDPQIEPIADFFRGRNRRAKEQMRTCKKLRGAMRLKAFFGGAAASSVGVRNDGPKERRPSSRCRRGLRRCHRRQALALNGLKAPSKCTLVEPNEAFISCPMSNLVLGGSKTLADVTVNYTGLDKYGVKRMRDTVSAVDADKKQVRLLLWRQLFPTTGWSSLPASSSCTTSYGGGPTQRVSRLPYCTHGRLGRRPSRCAGSSLT